MKHPRVDKALQKLVTEASSHKFKSNKGCADVGVPIRHVIKGWSVILSVYEHDGKDHWHFSAQLYPRGRGSTKSDWSMLGYMTAVAQDLTGYPRDAPPIEPLTPLDTTHPNRVHHWAWHSDGSPIDPGISSSMQNVLS